MLNVHDAGVDWLTLTFKPEYKDFDRAQNISRNILWQLAGGRVGLKSQTWQGYKGYCAYSLFAGDREDGFCVRASASEAKLIEREFRQQAIKGSCTRIDLQITAQDTSTGARFAGAVSSGLETFAGEGSGEKGIRLACYSVGGRSLGATVGSRSSQRYSRFYNKTEEQRGRVAPGLWRFEVEFKGEQAKMVHHMLMTASSGYWLSLSLVKAQFETYGVDMSWVTECDKLELPSQHRETDAERQLRWLQKPIAGVVRGLIEQGYEKEVRDIFGLH